MSQLKAGNVRRLIRNLRQAKPREVRRDRDRCIRCCRICGCTAVDACANMCHWIEDDLCSTCHRIICEMAEYLEYARASSKAAALRIYAEALALSEFWPGDRLVGKRRMRPNREFA